MPLPPTIDAVVRQRFDELITEAEQIIVAMDRDNREGHARYHNSGITYFGEIHYQDAAYHTLITKCLSLIHLVLGNTDRADQLNRDIRNLKSGSTSTQTILGILRGLKSDYESGMLRSLVEMIEAEVTANYLEQAEQLLNVGAKEQHNHIPAAVLAGAVLEDGLRRLCVRQSPPISVKKPGGSYKMLNALIDDLKNAGLFNELKAKQLRAWADIRNAAAHGQFDDFSRSDVEQMLAGIQNFLADYL